MAKQAFYRASNYGMKNSVGYLLRRTSNLLMPLMEALFADQALTFSQWTVLMALREGEIATAADLARNICHDAGSLTRIIDQLEERGLLTRRRRATDRREVSLALTPRGRALVETVMPRVVEFWNGLLGDFTTGEIKQLIKMLTRLFIVAEERRITEKNPRRRAPAGNGNPHTRKPHA